MATPAAALNAARSAALCGCGQLSLSVKASGCSLNGTPMQAVVPLRRVAIRAEQSSEESAPVEVKPPESPAQVPMEEYMGSDVTPTQAMAATSSAFKGGRAQETINGRAAMLGFVAAMGAELVSGASVLQQVTLRGDYPPGFPFLLIPTSIIFIVIGSFAPSVFNEKDNGLDIPAKPFGPFTPSAELINGRAAMIGFVALLAAEAATGGALF